MTPGRYEFAALLQPNFNHLVSLNLRKLREAGLIEAGGRGRSRKPATHREVSLLTMAALAPSIDSCVAFACELDDHPIMVSEGVSIKADPRTAGQLFEHVLKFAPATDGGRGEHSMLEVGYPASCDPGAFRVRYFNAHKLGNEFESMTPCERRGMVYSVSLGMDFFRPLQQALRA